MAHVCCTICDEGNRKTNPPSSLPLARETTNKPAPLPFCWFFWRLFLAFLSLFVSELHALSAKLCFFSLKYRPNTSNLAFKKEFELALPWYPPLCSLCSLLCLCWHPPLFSSTGPTLQQLNLPTVSLLSSNHHFTDNQTILCLLHSLLVLMPLIPLNRSRYSSVLPPHPVLTIFLSTTSMVQIWSAFHLPQTSPSLHLIFLQLAILIFCTHHTSLTSLTSLNNLDW